MRLAIGLFIVLVWPLSVAADPVLLEPPDFPANVPGPSADHPATDCFQLAAGSIEPGDVDWVQVVIPFFSLQTVVDVDITSPTGNSMMMTWIVGGAVSFNINDMNGAADDLCGLGASTDLLSAGTRKMFVNAAYWAVGLGDKIPEAGTNADIVGKFAPTAYAFRRGNYWGDRKMKVSEHVLED